MNWSSIREKALKIKRIIATIDRDILLLILMILVGSASFGLGRLSVYENMREPVRVLESLEKPQKDAVSVQNAATAAVGATIGGSLVGSKNGAKYHLPWCSGAQRILEKNKVWFASAEEARDAGYTPAANCKGLE